MFRLQLYKSNTFRFKPNWKGGTEISHMTLTPTHAQPALLPTSLTAVEHLFFFLTKDKLTLTQHNHPKPIVCFRVCSWCCIFYVFGQMYNDMHIYYYNTAQSIFTMCCAYSSPYPLLLQLFNISIVLLFPDCHIFRIIQYVAFQD